MGYSRVVTKFLWIVSILALHGVVAGQNNDIGKSPPMGWNSWNHYHCNVTQKVIEDTADAIVEKGLDKLGYKYVNIDDCWAKSRDSKGVIQPDPDTFPDFQGMIDHVHSKGLLFGLYSSAGNMTCQKRPGSLGYEEIDAQTYAEWKVDYLKYDNCYGNGSSDETRFGAMRDALQKTQRPIFYSMGYTNDSSIWSPKYGNSWRTTPDIQDNWDIMMDRADQNSKYAKYIYQGGWNDPDMLEIGNGNMTTAEYETHMSLWCLMKAPLLMGCDVTNMSDDTLRILSNEELIAINQDPMGMQGSRFHVNGTSEVWVGRVYESKYVVVLLNRGNDTAIIEVKFEDFVFGGFPVKVRDLWEHTDIGTYRRSVSSEVPSHGVKMYLLSQLR